MDDVDETDEILYDDEKKIKGATLQKLIERLTSYNEVEMSFLHDFLTTYRSFTTSEQLLNLLLERFKNVTHLDADRQRLIRLRVFNVLKLWLDKYWYDFEKDCAQLQDTVNSFLNSLPDHPIAKTVKTIFERQLTGKETKIVVKIENPTYIPKEGESLLDMKSLEIARQITMIEWNIWKRIQPWECLNLAWTKKDTASIKANNVLLLIERFNYVSRWVSTTICNTDKQKERVRVIVKFTEIAHQLHQMGNFNGVMEILSGLNQASVFRLKNTWGVVQEKHKGAHKTWQELNVLMEPYMSYANLRKALREVDPPCMPYLGMYLTDLTFKEEGNKDTIPGTNLINFYKRRLISETLKEIRQYQQKPYAFAEVPAITSKLYSELVLEEEEIAALSRWQEPRPGIERGERPVFNKIRKSQGAGVTTSKFDLDFVKEWQPFYVTDHPTNLVLEADELVVTSGIPTKVVERLTHNATPDAKSLQAFLVSYRGFMTPYELLDLLEIRYRHLPYPKNRTEEIMERFFSKMKIPIYLRVLNVLRHWIGNHWSDFAEDEVLKRKLIDYISFLEMENTSNITTVGILKQSIVKQEEIYEKKLQAMAEINICLPASETVSNEPVCSFLSFSPVALAGQLTLYVWKLFSKLKPEELLVEAKDTSNLNLILIHGSSLEHCLVKEIESSIKEGKEYQTLCFLVEVARLCKAENNWHCLLAIMEAFRKTLLTIRRAWEGVPQQDRQFYIEIQELIQNTTELQRQQLDLPAPCLPSIKAYLSKITQTSKKFVEPTPEGHINMAKQRAIAEVLQNISRTQQPYEITPDPAILGCLCRHIILEDVPEQTEVPDTNLSALPTWMVAPPPEPAGSHQTFFSMIQDDEEFKSIIKDSIRSSINEHMHLLRNELKGKILSSLSSASSPDTTPLTASTITASRRNQKPMVRVATSPVKVFNSSSPMSRSRASSASDSYTGQRVTFGEIYDDPKVKEVITQYFPNHYLQNWTHPETEPGFSVQILTCQNVTHLLHVGKKIDETKVAKMVRLGIHYIRSRGNVPLGCVLVCNEITAEAQVHANKVKMKVFHVL